MLWNWAFGHHKLVSHFDTWDVCCDLGMWTKQNDWPANVGIFSSYLNKAKINCYCVKKFYGNMDCWIYRWQFLFCHTWLQWLKKEIKKRKTFNLRKVAKKSPNFPNSKNMIIFEKVMIVWLNEPNVSWHCPLISWGIDLELILQFGLTLLSLEYLYSIWVL